MADVTEDVPRGEQVDQIIINILHRRMPYAQHDFPDAARDIRELLQSDDQLHEYVRLHNEKARSRELSSLSRSNTEANGSLRRISKPARERKSKLRLSTRSSARPSSNGSKSGRPAQSDQYGDPTAPSDSEQHALSTELSSERWHGPSNTAIGRKFYCIFDQKSFASKGNYRKHLEDQHVSRKFQQCEGCGSNFQSVPQAVNHCKSCPQDVSRSSKTPFHEIKMEKKVFGSEFTGECFTSMREYIDHLVEQSQHSRGCVHPKSSLLLKFRALLHQPSIRGELQSTLQSLLRRPDMPQTLSWNEEYMEEIIPILELGIIDIEPGPTSALRRHMVVPFLSNILNACWPTPVELPRIEAAVGTAFSPVETFQSNYKFDLPTTDCATSSKQFQRVESDKTRITLSKVNYGNEGVDIQYHDQNRNLAASCTHDGGSAETNDPALVPADSTSICHSILPTYPRVPAITGDLSNPKDFRSLKTAMFCSNMDEEFDQANFDPRDRRSDFITGQLFEGIVNKDYTSNEDSIFAEISLEKQSLSDGGTYRLPVVSQDRMESTTSVNIPETSMPHLQTPYTMSQSYQPTREIGQDQRGFTFPFI